MNLQDHIRMRARIDSTRNDLAALTERVRLLEQQVPRETLSLKRGPGRPRKDFNGGLPPDQPQIDKI